MQGNLCAAAEASCVAHMFEYDPPEGATWSCQSCGPDCVGGSDIEPVIVTLPCTKRPGSSTAPRGATWSIRNVGLVALTGAWLSRYALSTSVYGLDGNWS